MNEGLGELRVSKTLFYAVGYYFFFIYLKISDTICNIKAPRELYKYKDRKRGSESGF